MVLLAGCSAAPSTSHRELRPPAHSSRSPLPPAKTTETPTPPASTAPAPIPTADTWVPPPMSEGLYAWEHPLPEGFVPVPDPRENDPATAACMGLTVANKWDRATAGAEPFVEVTDASGRRVYLARGRHYDFEPGAPRLRMSLVVDYCGDLNADGVPELVLTERTMG
ncbi:MAG: hypothetical protein RIF41_27270, partial [Polyangiaceae bacterium]